MKCTDLDLKAKLSQLVAKALQVGLWSTQLLRDHSIQTSLLSLFISLFPLQMFTMTIHLKINTILITRLDILAFHICLLKNIVQT